MRGKKSCPICGGRVEPYWVDWDRPRYKTARVATYGPPERGPYDLWYECLDCPPSGKARRAEWLAADVLSEPGWFSAWTRPVDDSRLWSLVGGEPWRLPDARALAGWGGCPAEFRQEGGVWVGEAVGLPGTGSGPTREEAMAATRSDVQSRLAERLLIETGRVWTFDDSLLRPCSFLPAGDAHAAWRSILAAENPGVH